MQHRPGDQSSWQRRRPELRHGEPRGTGRSALIRVTSSTVADDGDTVMISHASSVCLEGARSIPKSWVNPVRALRVTLRTQEDFGTADRACPARGKRHGTSRWFSPNPGHPPREDVPPRPGLSRFPPNGVMTAPTFGAYLGVCRRQNQSAGGFVITVRGAAGPAVRAQPEVDRPHARVVRESSAVAVNVGLRPRLGSRSCCGPLPPGRRRVVKAR